MIETVRNYVGCFRANKQWFRVWIGVVFCSVRCLCECIRSKVWRNPYNSIRLTLNESNLIYTVIGTYMVQTVAYVRTLDFQYEFCSRHLNVNIWNHVYNRLIRFGFLTHFTLVLSLLSPSLWLSSAIIIWIYLIHWIALCWSKLLDKICFLHAT